MMKKMKNKKKAQAHVEMIISFALFVGAIMFIFFIMNPFAKTTQEKTGDVENIKNILIANFSSEFGRLSVIADSFCTTCCYYFDPAEYDYSNYIETIPDSSNPRKYEIYFSNDAFPATINPHYDSLCPGSGSVYTLGVFTKEKLLVYEKIRNIAQDSLNNYKGTASSLGIQSDYAFSFYDKDKNQINEISFSKKSPNGVNVLAREFPVRVINENGEIQEFIFNVRIW